ncbi:hypothetical protein [Bradyrhizobium sp. URHD0069]|uniref:hypothetical protein n=1 Tax=Bradyrhizobium sp. URHD0069 TaxID=1380355 RepID=UPI0004978B0D|nr:hypothetical protein [Bradyrhizobium sp. URHD0069]
MKHNFTAVLAVCIFCGSFAGTLLWISKSEPADPTVQAAITPLYFPIPPVATPAAAKEKATVAPSVQPTPNLEEDNQQRKSLVLREIAISPIGERMYLPEASMVSRFQTYDRQETKPYVARAVQFAPRGKQQVSINNRSLYDIRDLEIECFLLSETGVPLVKRTEKLAFFFVSGKPKTVDLNGIPARADVVALSCVAKNFEFVATPPG